MNYLFKSRVYHCRYQRLLRSLPVITSEIEWFKAWEAEKNKHDNYRRAWQRNDYAKNIDRSRIKNRNHYSKHAEKRRQYARDYRLKRKNNPELLKQYRQWCVNNVRSKKSSDPQFKLRFLMRNRIWMALQRGVAKSGPTVDLVGCSMELLKQHLESLWKPGMTWDNYGRHGWHIDHIKPCKSFDLTNPEEQRACFHYTNLQPLWWHENLSKGSKR